ncbi:MAG: hypothetical protein OES84_04000 [Kiritimatiellaceae bacterium]|nr:hypothetical protein [Kiritimatiellaceae bacterium]
MSLQWISILIGIMALVGGLAGIFRPALIHRFAEIFPRSSVPAWVFTALCCVLGAKEALGMNMGFLDAYKKYIYIISPAVFVASLVYMKELLAPRALGGFLCLIAVPIVRTASTSGSPLFQILVAVVYIWVIYGIALLMSPWYFRKLYQPMIDNEMLFKVAVYSKTSMGIVFILLGIFVY